MLCVVIQGPSFEQVRDQIERANTQADLLELRLDLLDRVSFEKVKELRKLCQKPVIFTLRPASQGGKYQGTEDQRLIDIERLLHLQPEFVDLEYAISLEFVKKISMSHPDVLKIISYHNFKETPQNLSEILREMQRLPAEFYKMAAFANSSLDVLRLANFNRRHGAGKILSISMGELGQLGRMLSPLIGNPWMYAVLDESQISAPGMLSVACLTDLYRHKRLNQYSNAYGLIGYPVDKSISHLTHNEVMKHFSLPGIYVKVLIKPEELKEFIELAKIFGWRGLSVTMPHKETVMEYLDEIDPTAKEMGAVNTIVFRNGRLVGYNTDSAGALDAIEDVLPVAGKKMVIIGAGGAAKAVAFEALQRGALVTILNRTKEKAEALALHLGCDGGSLEQMSKIAKENYDILVNATPNHLPIDPLHILSSAVIMDLTNRPKDTALLLAAKAKGCRIIYGYEMFFRQAVAQFSLWFEGQLPVQKVYDTIMKRGLEVFK